MPQRAIRTLETHKAMQDREREAAGKSWQETNLVFCHENGEMYTSRALNWRFSRMTRKAASATGTPTKGVTLRVDHEQQRRPDPGHQRHRRPQVDPHVTETVYRHVIVPTIRGGATVMDSVFGPEDDESA
jgi:hypothetical protein